MRWQIITQVSATPNSRVSKLEEDIRKIPNSHIKWLAQQIFRQKGIAIYIIVGTIISIAISMITPILTGKLFDLLWQMYGLNDTFGIEQPFTIIRLFFQDFKVNRRILEYALVILILNIVSFFINISVGILNENIAQRTERDIREEFYASVQSKSMAFHDTAKVGDLMSQATYDVRIINATISPGIRMITQAVITALTAFGMVFYYNWRIGIAVVLATPIYIITVRNYAQKLSPLTQKVQDQFGKCNAMLQENVSGIRVVRAFTAEKYEINRFGKEVDTLRDDIIKRGVQQALYFPPMILSVTIAICIGLSVWFITNGTMTGGEAIIINGALVQLYNPTYQISWVLYLTHMGLAGAKRILKTMKEEEIIHEDPDAKELTNVKGKIEYRNVNFNYHLLKEKRNLLLEEEDIKDEQGEPILEFRDTLQNINFTINPGEIVAILGPTGCGKSTITKLLARMYDVEIGEIFIDDKNIKEYTIESLRKNIGVIEQDIFLFSTSIKENIAYGTDRNVSDEEIIEYAKAAQAHDFIMSFEEGYNTVVGERGTTLSGGQKQRIAIARAFLANPKILILDDSASAIDAQTEQKIQAAMDKLLENRTVFIITHRLATIKRANKIIVMRKGQIVAQGQHDVLLRTSDDYRRVFGRHLDLPPIETIGEEATIGGTK
ncbi:MAG: ABC transporter ATP-binding protein [Asgard group archaeon]|nr:ABC transporter ATP-binding protein [Asgard group archaeon]